MAQQCGYESERCRRQLLYSAEHRCTAALRRRQAGLGAAQCRATVDRSYIAVRSRLPLCRSLRGLVPRQRILPFRRHCETTGRTAPACPLVRLPPTPSRLSSERRRWQGRAAAHQRPVGLVARRCITQHDTLMYCSQRAMDCTYKQRSTTYSLRTARRCASCVHAASHRSATQYRQFGSLPLGSSWASHKSSGACGSGCNRSGGNP